MSARVCNPVILSEISKLRSPAVGRRPTSSSISVARVKRDLFGPVDKEDSKKFIDRELAAQNNALSKKWGFDFYSGQPIQNHDQYQWERVPPTSAPACFTGMVTLTRVAHVVHQVGTASENLLDQRAERENRGCFLSIGSPASGSGSDSEADNSFETVRTYPSLVLRSASTTASSSSTISTSSSTTATTSSSFPSSSTRAKRQQRITDYLKERKRLSTGSPKAAPLAKKARQMLACSSSSPSSSAASSPSSSQSQSQSTE